MSQEISLASDLEYILEGRKEMFYSKVTKLFQHATFEKKAKYTLCITGIHEAVGNALWQHENTSLNDEEMAEVLSHLKKIGHPFFWWGAPHLQKNQKQEFKESKFLIREKLTFAGMLTGICTHSTFSINDVTYLEGITIKRVQTESELKTFFSVFSKAFETSQRTADELLILTEDATWKGDEVQYLAYHNNIPMGCLTLTVGKHTAGIWNFGILKEYRQRGYGAFLIQTALKEAKNRGFRDVMAILMMDQKINTWAALGFQEVCYFPLYIGGTRS